MAKCLADLGEEVLADHVIADIDGYREPFSIGPAVAFYHDTVEAKQHASIGFGRIHLFADRVKGRPLPAIAAEIGATSWAQFALKWIVSHPAVTCAIPGTNDPKHMLDNIEAGIGAMPDAAMRAKMAKDFESI